MARSPYLDSGLISFDLTRTASHLILFTEHKELAPRDDPQCKEKGCLVTAVDLFSARDGRAGQLALVTVMSLRDGAIRQANDPALTIDAIRSCHQGLMGEISPDGRYGFRYCRFRDWPETWREYKAPPELQNYVAQENWLAAGGLFLTDFQTGTSSLVVNSPSPLPFWDLSPIWIDGGRYAIIPAALEPLDSVRGEEKARRASHLAVLLYEPATSKTERLGWIASSVSRIERAAWDSGRDTLSLELVGADGARFSAAFRRDGRKRWHQVHGPAAKAIQPRPKNVVRFRLEVEEGPNKPPVLVAHESKHNKRTVLLEPNAWLASKALGRVRWSFSHTDSIRIASRRTACRATSPRRRSLRRGSWSCS